MPRPCRAPWRCRRPLSRRRLRTGARRRRLCLAERFAGLDVLLDVVASTAEIERGRLVARHQIIERVLLGKGPPQRIVVADIHLHAAQPFLAGGANDLALERVIEAAAGHTQLGILAGWKIADIGAEGDDGEIHVHAGAVHAGTADLHIVGLRHAINQSRGLIAGIFGLIELPLHAVRGDSAHRRRRPAGGAETKHKNEGCGFCRRHD